MAEAQRKRWAEWRAKQSIVLRQKPESAERVAQKGK
jgi:hypothetical protein